MREKSITERIDAWLYARGFTNHDVRRLMRLQIIVCVLSLATGFSLMAKDLALVGFPVGSLLATWNFYELAKAVPKLLFGGYSRELLIALLAGFYFRLILTGVALFVLIAWGNVSIVALVAGLSTVVATIILWGAVRRGSHKAKEA